LVDRKRFAAKAGERSARVGECVYPNPKPGHPVAARNADHAEQQNDGHTHRLKFQQYTEVEQDDDRDEHPQQHQEFALSDQVSLAGLVNQFGNLEHGAMYRQILQPSVDRQAESQTEQTEKNSNRQQAMTVHAEKGHLREVWKLQAGFAGGFLSLLGEGGRTANRHRSEGDDHRLSRSLDESASVGRNTSEPGAHRDPPESELVRMTRCLSLTVRHTAPAKRSYSERRGAFAGVPNTLPPQDLNRSAKLGRVGCSAPKSPRSGSAASLGRARHKTIFYNMLAKQGQTGAEVQFDKEASQACDIASQRTRRSYGSPRSFAAQGAFAPG